VRVGLLELVGERWHDELEHLVVRALALEVARQRRRLVGRLHLAQRDVHLRGRDSPSGAPSASISPASKRALEPAAQREQRRLPLPLVRDAGQAAVVQLVAE
jgi:hypothetical protein